jgi:hypothetical protein
VIPGRCGRQVATSFTDLCSGIRMPLSGLSSLLAILLLAGGDTVAARGVTPGETGPLKIRLVWTPNEKKASTVQVAAFEDEKLVRQETDAVAGATIQLGFDLKSVTRIEIHTPLHASCIIDPHTPTAVPCVLKALVQIWPFGHTGHGRLWTRDSMTPNGSFSEAPPVPEEWGGGFALPAGRFDAVLAADGRAARLALGASPETLTLEPLERGGNEAYRLRATVLGPAGVPASSDCSVSVDLDPGASPYENRRFQTWAAYLKANPPRWSNGGVLLIEPWMADAVPLRLVVSGATPIRVVPFGRVDKGTLDLGTLRFASVINLRLLLRPIPAEMALPANLAVQLALERRAPGYSSTTDTRLDVSFDSSGHGQVKVPVPGEWRATIRSGKVALGEHTILVEGPTQEEELEIQGATVEGRVQTPTGKAISDCEVTVASPSRSGGARSSTPCDNDGRFRLDFLHAGGRITIEAHRASDGSWGAAESVDPLVASPVTIVIRTAGFSVLVTSATTNLPINGAEVELVGHTSDGEPKRWGVTNDQGRASFASLEDGTFDIDVTAPGFAPYRSLRAFTVSRADQSTEITVALKTAGRARGIVVDQGGNAIPGATLARLDHQPIGQPDSIPPDLTVSDAEGRFEMDLGIGSSPVAIWAPGYRLDLATLAPRDEDFRLVLFPRGADTRLEFFTNDGRPMRNALWVLARDGIRIPRGALDTAFSASGCVYSPASIDGSVFAGGCLAPGSYNVYVRILRHNEFVDLPAGTADLGQPGVVRLVVPLPK